MAALDKGLPSSTRLRYVKSKDPSMFQIWLDKLGSRVQIYSMVWDGSSWFLWFVPDDRGLDIDSVDLDSI